MKRLSLKELDKIERWEDVPLSKDDMKRNVVRNDEAIVNLVHLYNNNLNPEYKEKLIKLLQDNEVVYFDLEVDYEGYIDECRFIGGGEKNTHRNETDEEYNKRINELKKRTYDMILKSRVQREKQRERNKKASERKKKREYTEYLRLKKKFEKTNA